MQYQTLNNRHAFDSIFEDLWALPPTWAPATEIEESEGHFLLSLETPGMKQSDLSIELVESRLSVAGESVRRGKFRREFTLPASADSSKIEAQYENGVLSVYVPKVEKAKPRQVKIGQASEGMLAKLLGKKTEILAS